MPTNSPEKPRLISFWKEEDEYYVTWGTSRAQCEAKNRICKLAIERAKYYFFVQVAENDWDLSHDAVRYHYVDVPHEMSTWEIRIEAELWRDELKAKGINIGKKL
jgi:hypothetical protein